MPPRTAAGYVLAGGRSSRMGTDKAALRFRGETLIGHVARAVGDAAESVTIVGGGERDNLRVIRDPVPGYGPVAGVVAALRDSAADWTLIVACDMPGIAADFLASLIAAAEGQVLIPRTRDGRIHPLCAVWHRSAQPAMEQALASGIHTVREAIRGLDCRWYEPVDSLAVSNVNTPDEWARVRE